MAQRHSNPIRKHHDTAPGKRIILVYASRDDSWRQRLEDRLVVRANDRERFPAGLSVEAWSDEYLAESARAPDTLRDEVENVAAILLLDSDDFSMDAAACDRMVRGLLRTSVKRPDQDSKEGKQERVIGKITMPAAGAGTSSGIPVTPQQQMSGVNLPAAAKTAQQQVPQSASAGSASAGSNVGTTTIPTAQQPAYPTFESLEIIPAELDFMTKLAPVLGRSPRALKRFVNVYRLIKAGLGPHEERSFPRPGNPLGHYQAVLLLLAVDTGTPMLARNFFATVERGAIAAPVNEIPHDIGWLMKEMDQDWLEDATGWQRLRGWLETHDEEVPTDTRFAVLAPWTKRVVRFLFEVGRS